MAYLSPLPPPSAEEARVTHVRASMFRGMRQVAEAADGEGGWERLVACLSDDARAAFQAGLDSFRWIETPSVNALAAAHEARFGPASIGARARAAVQEQLRGSHPGILNLVDAAEFLQQSPTIFRFYYRGGRADLDELGPGRALISIHADGLFPSWYTTSCPVWLGGALELAGASGVSVRHHPPKEGPRHRYELGWVVG
jgi:hypothetical protein